MKWSLETRNLKDLHENPNNPRKLSKLQGDNLKVSIDKFGLCEPIVINVNGLIIGGHQRFKTLKRLGHQEAQVYVPDQPLSPKEVEELTIRLNANRGSFDYDILANCWELQDLINWGMEQDKLLDEKEEKVATSFKLIITCSDEAELSQYEQELVAQFPYMKIKSKVK